MSSLWQMGLCRPAIALLLAMGSLVAVGCASSHQDFPYLPGGEIQRTHPKPMEGGFYANFDPQAHSIDLTPVEDTNPVKTQHVLIATVRDQQGKPLPNRRVHWILSRGGVGDIVDVDASGWLPSRGHQVTSTFAETHTNRFAHVLDRGTADPADDIHLEPGQTWIVITSPVEGDTFITAYAPGIYNWEKHKAFAVKHWVDAQCTFPPPACNRADQPHTFTTHVRRASDNTPAAGRIVRYTLKPGGPAAGLSPGGGSTVEVPTDAAGNASVTIAQKTPYAAGVNTVAIEVLQPMWDKCCRTQSLQPIARAEVQKTWDLPQLAVTKTGPASATVCKDEISYTITVRNTARCAAAEGVVLKDTLSPLVTYTSSTPAGALAGRDVTWTLGTLKPGEAREVQLRVKPASRGTARNVATATAALAPSASAEAVTQLVQPELKLTKTVVTPVVYVGEMAVFRIGVQNTGDAPVGALRLLDTFDRPGLQYAAQPEASQLAATVPPLAPGASSPPIDVALKTTAPGQFVNTVRLVGQECLPELCAQATVKVVAAGLTVCKTGPAETYLKKKVPFTLTVSNPASGPFAAPAENVVLVDTPPAGLTFVSADSGGLWTGGQVRWSLGTLQPGQSRTVSVILQADQMGRFCNPVTATADRGLRAQAEHCLVVRGVAGLLIEVIDTVDPIMVFPGRNEQTTYLIKVTNQGTLDAERIRLVFEVPAEEKFISTAGPTAFAVSAQGAKTIVTYEPVARIPVGGQVSFQVVVEAARPGDARFKAIMTSEDRSLDAPVVEEESTHVYDGH